jgi:hypothetical protein
MKFILILFFVSSLFSKEHISICTMEYKPVCGFKKKDAEINSKYKFFRTFGNKCMLDKNKNYILLYTGECITKNKKSE